MEVPNSSIPETGEPNNFPTTCHHHCTPQALCCKPSSLRAGLGFKQKLIWLCTEETRNYVSEMPP